MTLPRPVAGVVFDMDGLLVDTETLIRDIMLSTAPRFGADLPLEVFLSMVGRPSADSHRIAVDHFGAAFPYDAYVAEIERQVHAACEAGIALKAGVVELLDHLEAAAIPHAIATSSSLGAVQRTLGPSGLLPRFQAIVAAGDYARGKPNPDPFLTAAERLGLDPAHCLALEDSHNGVRAAHAAGMMTIMVPDLLEATDEMHSLAVMIADSLHHVADLLRR